MGKTQDIIARAMKDPAFHDRLLKDPTATIKQEFGLALPAGATVKVHENTTNVINLVLPARTEGEAGRNLSERELEMVAGGMARSRGAAPISPWIGA